MSTMILQLVDQGRTDWRIVVGKRASASEIYAGSELQHFVKQMSGVEIPIVDDSGNAGPGEIWVGLNDRTAQRGIDIDLAQLGDDGFVIRTLTDGLLIAGSNVRGTLNGVYTFLEDTLGCRWFAPDVSQIPQRETIEIGPIDDRQVPVLEYREPYSFSSFDGDWAARNKANGNFHKLEQRHGGKIDYTSLFVHTFDHFVPVERYFDEHPEYFSEIEGKRISDRTQLCLTNEAVLQLTIAGVKQWIEDHPGIRIVSVSQNDWYNPCQCMNCRAIDEAEGSYSGTLLHFVNKVAEAIEQQYPDVAIDTLAYQYTRRPPKHVRPRGNVIVRLCSIECCFSHPLDSCEEIRSFKNRTGSETSFASDLRQWAKVSDRLYIWDYVTNFSNYVMPFPNFGVLQSNIRFFIQNNVKGIFEQGCYVKGGELTELRTYVLSKLLWNPDYDTNVAIDEFLAGYFGNAAAPIREYIDMLHRKVKDEHIHMGIYEPPTIEYLSEDLLRKADELFDQAEQLADSDEIRQRLHIARLPIRYVKLARMPVYVPNRKKLVEQFFADLEQAGIREIWEGRTIEKSRMFMEEGTIFRHSSL